MGIVELLRRLAQAARSRDARTAQSLLGLATHYGWGQEVTASIGTMPSQEAAFVLGLLTPAAESRVAGGGGDYLQANREQGVINPYPRTAEHLRSATGGFGVWTGGAAYLCDEAYGSLLPVFGSVPLAPGSTPTYSNAGAFGPADLAVGFDSDNDCFDGGNNFNVGAADDLFALWVAFAASVPAALVDSLFSKVTSGAGYQINFDNVSGNFYFQGFDATPTTLFTAIGASPHLLSWHVGGAVIERGTARARLATRSLSTGASSAVAEQSVAASSMSNAVAFRLGERADTAGIAPTTMRFSFFAITTGASVAVGCSANLPTILQNFATYLRA